MSAVKIDQFHGIAPRQHPTKLADGMAVTAHNVKLKNGKLVPLREPLKAVDVTLMMEKSTVDVNGTPTTVQLERISDARSIHAWKKTDGDVEFLLFPGVTWMAEGNIADDSRTRVVISGDTGVDFGVTHNAPQIYMRNPLTGRKIIHPLCKNPLPPPKVRRLGGELVADVEIVSKGYKSVAQINALSSASLTKGWTYVVTDAGDITLGPDGTLSVVANTGIVWNGTNWVLSSDANLATNVRYTYLFMTWVDEYGYESPVSEKSVNFRERLAASDGWTISVDATTGSVVATKSGETTRTSDAKHCWVEYSGDSVLAANFYKKQTDSDYGSGDLMYLDGDTIQVAALGAGVIPDGAVKLRIYKVITGTEEGRIQFIAETNAVGMDANPLNITVKDEDAGEVLTEIEAPYSDLRCVQDVPGAYYVGFSPSHPKTVCFSAVDLLYSWPVAYQYDVADNIVALAVTSNTVFALTDGWPYVLSGTDPSGMSVTKLAGPASCVSPRGVCVYKNAVYYVGQQGLMTIYNDADAGTVCANLTDAVFTKDQWQALNPSSCVMGQFDGALHLFFTLSNGTHKGYSIELSEGANAVTTHDEVAKCVCVDNKADRMYYVREQIANGEA